MHEKKSILKFFVAAEQGACQVSQQAGEISTPITPKIG